MGITEPTLKRLPLYYKIAKEAISEGNANISCTKIAQKLGLIPILVRKDLQQTGIIGRPKTGYSTSQLIEVLDKTLDYKNEKLAFLVGVGNLGNALINYSGFQEYGMKIVALFDGSKDKIGTKINDMEIYDIAEINQIAKKIDAKIGIITTPALYANDIALRLIDAGIKALWNFAPTRLDVPEDVIVENVNLSVSLSVLNSKIYNN